MTSILVVGSINADLVVRAPRFPRPGETLRGEDLQIIPGGKGANQAVAAARQGSPVAIVGRVGQDSFGPTLIDNLRQNRVDTSHVQIDPDSATGTALIVVDAEGQNSIVISAGGNGRVTPGDLREISLADVRLLLLQLEIPVETVLAAATLARESGVQVLLNPAPAQSLPEELIAMPDFLVPNETELGLLTGQPVEGPTAAEKAARSLLERGVRNVIVTLGAQGALLVNRETTKHIPSFPVDVVDTTAAGDSFIGGFAAALLEGRPLEEAIRYGCASGALAATKFGAQPSLPTRADVARLLEQSPRSTPAAP